jgi:hypothetical protein
MTRARAWWPVAGAVAAAPIAGTLTAVSPRVGLLSAAALSVVVIATYYRQRLPQLFLVLVGISLFGYTFLGKGYAYFGVSPIFIGELLLLFGVLAALLGGGFRPALRSPISWLVIVWGVWGLVCTVPYLGVYGLDALRDATIWGYGAFAILVAGFMLRLHWWTKASDAYARWFWWFAFWSPVAGVIFATIEPSIPRVPGSDIPLLFVKAGDYGVQLAGAATFVLVGLADARWRRRPHRAALEWLWWMAWLAGVAITGATSRGALLSVFIAVATVMFLHRRAELWKPALVSFVFALVFVSADVKLIAGQEREVSARQIVDNLRSIVGGQSKTSNLEGTRTWRLQWWQDIIDYTVHGRYFWMGKGFGINLADDDDYQGTVNGLPNRSPHNIQMTVLARAGVPGLVVWSLLQSTFALSLAIAFVRARRERREWWARVNLWILSFWLAFMVNAAFDVYLEGPQGGIWFWCLIGFGIAALEAQRAERIASRQSARAKALGHAPHTTPTPSMPQPALPNAVPPHVLRRGGIP